MSTCILAWTFGIRHAFDADHLAAIDNIVRLQSSPTAAATPFVSSSPSTSINVRQTQQETRDLEADMRQQNDHLKFLNGNEVDDTGNDAACNDDTCRSWPITPGLYFSAGHSIVVLCGASIIILTTQSIKDEAWKTDLGYVGVSFSCFVLSILVVVNSVMWHKIRTKLKQTDSPNSSSLSTFEESIDPVKGQPTEKTANALLDVIRESSHLPYDSETVPLLVDKKSLQHACDQETMATPLHKSLNISSTLPTPLSLSLSASSSNASNTRPSRSTLSTPSTLSASSSSLICNTGKKRWTGLKYLYRTSLIRSVDRPWKMLIIGFLFGLGFDTATEVALLGLTATNGSHMTSNDAPKLILLPFLFAAGKVQLTFALTVVRHPILFLFT